MKKPKPVNFNDALAPPSGHLTETSTVFTVEFTSKLRTNIQIFMFRGTSGVPIQHLAFYDRFSTSEKEQRRPRDLAPLEFNVPWRSSAVTLVTGLSSVFDVDHERMAAA